MALWSHVQYKNIDNLPPTLSKKWIKILRNELRYNGIIYSDDLSMHALNLAKYRIMY